MVMITRHFRYSPRPSLCNIFMIYTVDSTLSTRFRRFVTIVATLSVFSTRSLSAPSMISYYRCGCARAETAEVWFPVWSLRRVTIEGARRRGEACRARSVGNAPSPFVATRGSTVAYRRRRRRRRCAMCTTRRARLVVCERVG